MQPGRKFHAVDASGPRRDLLRALKEAVEAAGLSFPYPQRDVQLFEEGGAA